MQDTIFLRDLAIVLILAAAVGWTFQRIGLSAVVGYLLAGIGIGPFSPVWKLVSDLNHIQLLSQIGLIFLMFAIGLSLSFARLQRMGLSIVAAVVMSSIVLFNVCRWFGSALGWNNLEILFLAGTLMISSSAIITKVLDELNITHQRAGQLALGITVLEDIVAVVMLTLFISMIKVGGDQGASLWSVLGSVSAFVVFLMVIAMLSIPRILKVLSQDPAVELRVIAVTGLVLLGALAALQAGYSLALGAFVIGVVIGGTRYKDELEKALAALQTIFGAVFFVAVGMMFDYRLLASVWWLVGLVTILTVLVRPLACAFGLIAAGHSSKNALKAGIALTPIGEFAFIMIQVGKSSNVLPEHFYALAIGVSLTTAIIGPLLTRRSEAICSWLEKQEPKRLREIVAVYHRWLEALHVRSNASLLWRLSSKRVFHIAFHLLFVSALILFSKPAYSLILARLGNEFSLGFGLVFWAGFGIVLLGPVIVLWRNVEALAMIIADGATHNSSRRDLLRPILQALLKSIGAIVLLGWLLLLIPVGRLALWALGLSAAAVVFYLPVFWRRLVSLHDKLEFDLREKMKTAATLGASSGLPTSVLERPQEWNLEIDEVMMPLGSEHAGRRISDLAIRKNFGCSIVAIDRQGFLITNPTATERLFAADKLLLLGTPLQLSLTEQFLRGGAGSNRREQFAEITMETLEVPAHSREIGKSLADLSLVARFGVQVCGIKRDGARILVPSSTERLANGDTLLLLGTHENIQSLQSQLWTE